MPGRHPSTITGRFPNRVRELRLDAGLTQEQLGEKLGVTFSAIGKLERGASRLRVDQAQALSRIFDVHELELFLPLTIEERQALQLLRKAEPAMRERMLQMLRMMAAPLDNRAA